jgi:hypothetical protein
MVSPCSSYTFKPAAGLHSTYYCVQSDNHEQEDGLGSSAQHKAMQQTTNKKSAGVITATKTKAMTFLHLTRIGTTKLYDLAISSYLLTLHTCYLYHQDEVEIITCKPEIYTP